MNDPYYLAGRITGSILTALVISYVVLWIWNKIGKKEKPKLKEVLILAAVIFILSLIGNLNSG
jgi:hypothetical protein